MLCNLVDGYQCFSKAYCLHLANNGLPQKLTSSIGMLTTEASQY